MLHFQFKSYFCLVELESPFLCIHFSFTPLEYHTHAHIRKSCPKNSADFLIGNAVYLRLSDIENLLKATRNSCMFWTFVEHAQCRASRYFWLEMMVWSFFWQLKCKKSRFPDKRFKLQCLIIMFTNFSKLFLWNFQMNHIVSPTVHPPGQTDLWHNNYFYPCVLLIVCASFYCQILCAFSPHSMCYPCVLQCFVRQFRSGFSFNFFRLYWWVVTSSVS